MRILILFLLLTSNFFGQDVINVGSSTYLVNQSQLILKDIDIIVDGNLNTNGVIKINNGNFTINGGFNPGIGQVIFTNTTTHDQYLTVPDESNNTFYDLHVLGDNTTQYDLHLLSNINVTNHLQIQSQKFNLNGKYIDLGTTGHIYYEGDGQYIYDNPDVGSGYVQATVTINTNTTVNPGNLGLEITTHGNQMGLTTIKRLHKKGTIDEDRLSINRIFDVTPTYNGINYGGNLNVDLKFQYFNDILGSVSDVSTIKLYRSGDGGITWENKGGNVDIDNGFVTVTGFNQFSQVTLAEDNGALPISLSSFYGDCQNNVKRIGWVTSSEYNNDYFNLEGSRDGINWVIIGNIVGSGNSQSEIKYESIVKEDLNYFKLTQYDFNGDSEMFGPIVIDCDDNNVLLTTQPNPTRGSFDLSIKGLSADDIINYTLFNQTGQILDFDQKIIMGNTHILNFNKGYVPGVYYLTVTYLNKSITIKQVIVD